MLLTVQFFVKTSLNRQILYASIAEQADMVIFVMA